MRIKGISVIGFGGISEEIVVDLDADVVVLVGANGFGKTTICNAIAWALSGKSPGAQGPQNLYSKSGTTSVELRAQFGDDEAVVLRSIENPGETNPKRLRWPLRVRTADQLLEGSEAEAWLVDKLDGTESSQEFAVLAESFVESIYLQQESLREFLTEREDDERFDVVAAMVGAGRLRNFLDQLQSHKRAWVRAIGQSEVETQNDRAKLEDLEATLKVLDGEIERASAHASQGRWQDWVASLKSLELVGLPADAEWQLSEETLSQVRTVLSRARSDVEQRESALLALRAELLVPLPEKPGASATESLVSQVTEATTRKSQFDEKVLALQSALERAEMEFEKAESLREDLASMATILLRHVGDECVACGQGVIKDEYRERLQGLAAGSADQERREAVELLRQRLQTVEADSRREGARLSMLIGQQRELQERLSSAVAAEEHRTKRLTEVFAGAAREVGDEPTGAMSGLDKVDRELKKVGERREVLIRTTEAGRLFELAASLGASTRRRSSLSAELLQLRGELDAAENDVRERRRTSDFASTLIETVRADAETFVSSRLAQLRPLLTQCYAAIDPHPTFRSVDIATRQFGGKHRLTPRLRDEHENVDVVDPGETLSTSQANALAVSLFLSFNLGFAPTTSTALILDDPLQNLDDVHLLGLVDLLRKILPSRQLIITTHDAAFADLLARKLRPVTAKARTTYVRFTKWDRNGPGIEQWDVPVTTEPLKLVGSNGA